MMKQEHFLSSSHRHLKPRNKNGEIEILLASII